MGTTALALSKPQLHLPRTTTRPQPIVIRQPRTDLERKLMYQLRYEIYTHEGFIVPDRDNPFTLDRDRYDARSVHWTAFVGSRLVGTIRAVPYSPTEPSMLEEFFTIDCSKGIRSQVALKALGQMLESNQRYTNLFD